MDIQVGSEYQTKDYGGDVGRQTAKVVDIKDDAIFYQWESKVAKLALPYQRVASRESFCERFQER